VRPPQQPNSRLFCTGLLLPLVSSHALGHIEVNRLDCILVQNNVPPAYGSIPPLSSALPRTRAALTVLTLLRRLSVWGRKKGPFFARGENKSSENNGASPRATQDE